MRRTRASLLGAAIGASLLTSAAGAVPPGRSTNTSHVRQQLIARTPVGGAPNAAAAEPTISWDARVARYVAYTSTATNITPGTSGRSNVFLVVRGGGHAGAPWTFGATMLASGGLGGGPADGDSFGPSLGGWTQGDRAHEPRCLAFVSTASNLVSGDTNGRPDAFVRGLPSGSTHRIPSPHGRSASEVAMSGDCRSIAIVASGTLYLKRGGHGLKKLAGGGVTSPSLSYNGSLSYARAGRIHVRGRSGAARRVGSGSHPAAEAGKPSNPHRGRIRAVAYRRGGVIYYKDVGGRNRRVAAGTAAQPTGGGGQVMFGSGPFVYAYAKSNNFGKKAPQGFCPAGQGRVTATYPSARGNYLVFSCSGGGMYLSYLGGK